MIKLDKGVARTKNKYLKIPWKFLTLMTSHWHPRSSVREMIIYLRVTSTSIYCCTIRILAAERPEILVIICCYLFLRQERVHINIFLKNKFVYKEVTVRYSDYLNRCRVLYVYFDITVLIWQKVNEANIYRLKVKRVTLRYVWKVL